MSLQNNSFALEGYWTEILQKLRIKSLKEKIQ
jgi:hypothetical protein